MNELKTVPATMVKEFEQVFGRSLSDFWDITGFDVIGFDESFIQPEDGYSTADTVRMRYGNNAMELCHKLIKHRG